MQVEKTTVFVKQTQMSSPKNCCLEYHIQKDYGHLRRLTEVVLWAGLYAPS